jgi:16S rRNA (guanine966-N2)-methyltransferase
MKIRIISGKYGGRMIGAPSGKKTHPMGDRVRTALFNIISSDMVGAKVLDVFAGTGSLGLEALSRGASSATFVEKDRVAAAILRENVQLLNVSDVTRVVQAPLASWISTQSSDSLYDVIFADPPYHDVQFSTIEKLFTLLKPGGLMVLSHPGRGEVPFPTGIVVVDNRSYANAHLTLFRREPV